jgi:hypothetical protein
MSGKPNPYENSKSRRKVKPVKHEKRITYTHKRDATNAANRRGGNSRPYKVKGGWRITRR